MMASEPSAEHMMAMTSYINERHNALKKPQVKRQHQRYHNRDNLVDKMTKQGDKGKCRKLTGHT